MLWYLHHRASPPFDGGTVTYSGYINSYISIYSIYIIGCSLLLQTVLLHTHIASIAAYWSILAVGHPPLFPGTLLHTHVASIAACLYFCCTVTPKILSILILNMMHEAQHLIAWESHLALVGI